MSEKNYLQDLSEIKNIMNRSTRFMSLSGLSGIMAGIYALIGAFLAKQLLANYLNYNHTRNTINPNNIEIKFKELLKGDIHKNYKEFKSLYNECIGDKNCDAIKGVILLIEGDFLENKKEYIKAYNKYKNALNSIENLDEFDIDNSLKNYLKSQLNRYSNFMYDAEKIIQANSRNALQLKSRGAILQNLDLFKSISVNFETDKYEIKRGLNKAQVDYILNSLKNLIKKDKINKVIIVGYTDTRGRCKYNEKLSINRANAIKQYFIQNGINIEIIIQGKGEINPKCIEGEAIKDINDKPSGFKCSIKEDYFANRRVKVIPFKEE